MIMHWPLNYGVIYLFVLQYINKTLDTNKYPICFNKLNLSFLQYCRFSLYIIDSN